MRAKRFDIVNPEFPFLGQCHLRQAPPGQWLPRMVADLHYIEYDLMRQFVHAGASQTRRL